MDMRFISELAKRILLDKTAFDKAIYELENDLDSVLYIKENASLSNMKPFVKALKKDREKGAPVCLAAALLISEDAYKQYKKLGISDEVFYDTFSDISVWVNTAKREENIDGLLEVWWIRHILYLNMFKLGRMQYQFYKTDYILSGLSPLQALKAPIKNKSRVLNIHISEGARLDYSECEKSVLLARKFFSEYFPEYDYKGFVCDSWLLDPRNAEFMSNESNIMKFSNLFCTVMKPHKNNKEIIRRLWGKQNEKTDFSLLSEDTDLQKRTKNYLLLGGKTGNGYGFILK